MSEKKDKKTSDKSCSCPAVAAANPTYIVADRLICDLDRVHIRLPKF